MRSVASDNRLGGARYQNAGCDDSSKSLYDHASSFFLPVTGPADDRNDVSPEAAESLRNRQVLAKLIGIVEPDQAVTLSGALLEEFGSIGRLLGESEAALSRVLDSNKHVIRLLKASEDLMIATLRNALPRKLVAATDQRLVTYLQARMGSRSTELMRILFLDSSHHLLGDQEFGEGSPRRIYVQPRTILKRALELDASGLILAHNHPGGSVSPSSSDIEFTMSIRSLCLELDICLLDHIIITSNGWSSFRKLKII
ncbi:JAB domain-containing protein [Sphingorhabdus sp. SMR4y]|uniref:JAB domain-containing protein n=1 Tax=Sphingorhabdus sp. SMR4y TaxID=2584094 RepID=UPI000B5CB114|nr:JAB domain-containing protein [Sphingorhabdus sp. SMR4y]